MNSTDRKTQSMSFAWLLFAVVLAFPDGTAYAGLGPSGLYGDWKAVVSCGGSSNPYLVDEAPFESTFVMGIWPKAKFTANLVINGTVCTYQEAATFQFGAANTLTVASQNRKIILDPRSHASCPPPREMFDESIIGGIGLNDTYTYTFSENEIVGTAWTDTYCNQYGFPGTKATLTLSRY